ncbi:hypothetical protein [uncultured Pseudoteredinibacter sp.]|uniref:hypothetical protein n=1 Tax=uncultured Pseudoteredinibacter sp. TaxID=1641701 RepID=UPI002630B180|nr:hypothetical protein [uncultured Pseudoteredinibacter sp.]
MIHRFLLAAALLAANFSISSYASIDSETLSELVTKRYGGDKLVQLNQLWLRDRYIRIDKEQSFYPGIEEAKNNDAELLIDFQHQKMVLRYQGEHDQQAFYQHQLLNEKGAYSLDDNAKEFSTIKRGFSNIAGGLPYRMDIFWAKLISLYPDKLSNIQEQSFYAKDGYQARFSATGFSGLSFNISLTGDIVSLTVDGRKQQFQFGHHQITRGLRFAEQLQVAAGGNIRNISVKRELLAAKVPDEVFELPVSYKAAKTVAQVMPQEMQIQKLAEGVYHVGKSVGFSLFVEVGDSFYGVGGYQGLGERFEALQATLKSDKPLAYQIVSHHHYDHLGGMQEAADLGATFIGSAKALEVVDSLLSSKLPQSRYQSFVEQKSIAEGRLLLAEFENPHVANHMVTLLPKDNILFAEDLYFSLEATGAPEAEVRHIDLGEWLSKLRVNVEKFSAGHSVRILNDREFVESLSNPKRPEACPTSWHICNR